MAGLERLEPEYAEGLLRRQAALQAEAEAVLADLDLAAVLARAGRPVRLGSSVLGLMAWRDLDLLVLCDQPSPDLAFATMRPLAEHPRVKQLRYSNESGPFNATGRPEDDGYYWGIRYYPDRVTMWKLDVWFVAADAPRPDLRHLETIPPRLTPETRLAILWLKDVWHRRPAYRDTVLSVDIYDAVLQHGVRTPGEFAAYLRARGKVHD